MNHQEQLLIVAVDVIIVVVVFSFALLALATVNSVLARPLIPRLKVDRRYLRRLYQGIIINGVVGLAAIPGHILGLSLQTKAQDLETTTNRFGLTQDAWQIASDSWMDEPSGFAASGLTDAASDRPLFVGVDDEEEAIFVLDVLPGVSSSAEKQVVVRAMLPLHCEKRPKVKDLEGIAYDRQQGYYYAVTSHRVGVASSGVCELLKFRVDGKKWQTPRYEISVGENDIADLSTSGGPGSPLALANLVHSKASSFDEAKWRQYEEKGKGQDERRDKTGHEFQLEIEGLAYLNGDLYLGLKWPLGDDGRPLLLVYSTTSHQFKGIHSLDLSTDSRCKLGEWGIRSLDVYEDFLIVVADQWGNPGQYSVQAFKLTDIQGSSAARAAKAVADVTPALPPRKAFLEGIAVGDSDALLGYDKPPAGTHSFDVVSAGSVCQRITDALGTNAGTR